MSRRRGVVLAVVSTLAAVMSVSGALAQGGRQIQTYQNSVIERYQPPLRQPPSVGVTVTAPVAGIPASELTKVRFRLTAIDLVGAGAVSEAQLTPLWSDLLGTEVSLADLSRVVEGIGAVYLKNDYYALAVIPPQDFASGRIRIVVYESYVREVVINGDIPGLQRRIHPYVERIVAMTPIRVSRLERYLLLMADLAGITLNAEISKIEDDPGAARLVLDFQFNGKTVAGRLDNFGNDEVGPLEASINARFNDAFGAFESTDALLVTNPLEPTELVFGRLSQLYPLGPSGLTAGYEIGQVASEPGGDLADLNLHAETTTAKVHIDYAFMRRIKRSLFGSLALNSKSSTVDSGDTTITRDRNSWVTAGATYNDTIAGAAVILDVAYAQGLDGLGSNTPNSDFRFLSGEANISRDLTDTVYARLQGIGQLALSDLPSSMRFDIGGENYGRAFDGSTISGKDGAAAAFEIGKRIDLGIDWLAGFTLFAFADYGAVWNGPNEGQYGYAAVGSAGAGVRTRLGRHGMVAAYFATPYLDTADASDMSTRFRFNAGFRY
ncbi:MAG: ShlB/FhaC/HecB family hemolysin secretion/activation protein [Bauldia sp.]|nr:ShlB/FhaC/HecB family hemolysin secretion/activation protein [Bauldia sp.]